MPLRLFLIISFYLSSIVTFIFLQIFTIFYIIETDFNYSNEPTYKKEIVDLGYKKIPNPVYFMRHDIGKEKIEVAIDYSFNHYAWLKYAGFQSALEKPYFGQGVGMFKNALDDLVKSKKIDPGLKDFNSAQSQYFNLVAEIGFFGFLIIFYLISLCLYKMNKVINSKEKNKNTLLLKSVYLSVPIISILMIDMDILSFRWFWGFIAISLISYKYSKS